MRKEILRKKGCGFGLFIDFTFGAHGNFEMSMDYLKIHKHTHNINSISGLQDLESNFDVYFSVFSIF